MLHEKKDYVPIIFDEYLSLIWGSSLRKCYEKYGNHYFSLDAWYASVCTRDKHSQKQFQNQHPESRYRRRISNHPDQTLSTNVNLAPQLFASFPSEDSGLEPMSYFGFLPTFDVEYRFYYNRQKRIDKGHKIYNNSGPYLAPHLKYSTNPIEVSGTYPANSFNAQFETGGMIGYQKHSSPTFS